MERLYKAPVKTWQSGTILDVSVNRIDHPQPRTQRYITTALIGSGFASQVHRAQTQSGEPMAIKLFRPTPFKETVRDIFHRAAWGTPLPYRILEPAVRVTEGWHDILARAALVEGLDDVYFPTSHGHFFDEQTGSFAGVYEWLNMEPLRPPVVGSQAEPDYNWRISALKRVYQLAPTIGMVQAKRQWDYWTLVAPLNARIVKKDGKRVVAILDDIPGLPVVAPFALSPGDVPRVVRMYLQGESVWFDRPDLGALDRYLDQRADSFSDLQSTVDRLKSADREYREALPGPFGVSLLFDKKEQQPEKRALVSRLLSAEKQIDTSTADKILRSDLQAVVHLMLDNIPLTGRFLQKLLANNEYQKHVWKFFTSPEYRHLINLEMVKKWEEEGRINMTRVDRLRKSDLRVLTERFIALQPRSWHRFNTDDEYARERTVQAFTWLVEKGTFIAKFPFSKKTRQEWMVKNIEAEYQKDMLSEEVKDILLAQAQDDKADKLIRDVLITTIGFNLLSWPMALGLAELGINLKNEPLTILAIASQTPLIPKISLASIMRAVFLTGRTISDRVDRKDPNLHRLPKIAEAANIVLALLSPFGNAAAPLRMAGEMPELSGFIAAHLLGKVVSRIPVFGERGTVTEAVFYEIFYNKWARRIIESRRQVPK